MSQRRGPVPSKRKAVYHIASEDETSPKLFIDCREVETIDLSKSDDENFPPPPKETRLPDPKSTRKVFAEVSNNRDIDGSSTKQTKGKTEREREEVLRHVVHVPVESVGCC